MAAVIPFITLGLLAFVLQASTTEGDAAADWRHSFLLASVLWGLVVTAITELLSLFLALTYGWLLGIWVSLAVALAISAYFVSRKHPRKLSLTLSGIPRNTAMLLLGVLIIVATAGVIAWIAPPNNWDSMTYHMARVVHWIQNRSVAHYPTNVIRQLYQNPWAEFVIAQLQILSGSDHYANFVQWFSMIGSLIGVSLIAKSLGANSRQQVFAAVIAATIPMGILQGSSTQNDYVVAFWLICCVYFVLMARENPRWVNIFAAGAGIGLAVLTKATAYIYIAPFLVWLAVSVFTRFPKRALGSFAAIVIIFLLINAGHLERNFALFGTPLGYEVASAGVHYYTNEVTSIPALGSNIVRNIGLHLGTPIRRLNIIIQQKIGFLQRSIGIAPDDPRTTFEGTTLHVGLSNHEDRAGNLLHVILIVGTLALILLSKQVRRSPALLAYSIALVAAFLLFSLYLKWQPWHSRLQLPLFVLWSPAIALALSRGFSEKIAYYIAAGLIVAALPWVLYNSTRPLVGSGSILSSGRTDQYFNNRPDLRLPYLGAARFLRSQKCARIGLLFNGNDWEYPLWVLLERDRSKIVALEHVNVENVSASLANSYPFYASDPCAIISLRKVGKRITYHSSRYVEKWSSGPVKVFVKVKKAFSP